MVSVAILGGDSSGGMVLQAIEELKQNDGAVVVNCVGFLNDVEPAGTDILGLPVLGGFGDWSTLPDNLRFISAIYNATAMFARWQRIESLGIPEDRWISVIHHAAWIAKSAHIGIGSYISPGANVAPNVRIGCHTAIRTSVHIGHDTTVGTYCFVGSNVSLNGRCTVGDRVHIGPNTAIRDGIVIGADAIVGIGSVVVKDIPPASVVVGNPAKVIRKLDNRMTGC